jgi:hypothetical protein
MGQINHIKTSLLGDGGDTSLIRPSDWNSSHAYTLQDAVSLSGNTAGVMSPISSGTFYLAGGSNITLSQDANSVTINGGNRFLSSYENFQFQSSITSQTLNGASISACVAFILPENGSFSFLRIPVLMTTNSTAINSTGGASATGGYGFYSTWNAVVYSLGTGASSRSLMSVASGAAGWTFSNSISIATNGSQMSITQGLTGQAAGNSTTASTQYSVSALSYPFSTNFITAYTSVRMLDIPFYNSLQGGAYWLVLGYSTSTSSNGASFLRSATNCNVRYSMHYCAVGPNLAFGIMGSTNLTSGGVLCAGSFSTAGGGTTSAFPISAISSSASNNRMYFQMLRSA